MVADRAATFIKNPKLAAQIDFIKDEGVPPQQSSTATATA
jgi:hypothetical protein